MKKNNSTEKTTLNNMFEMIFHSHSNPLDSARLLISNFIQIRFRRKAIEYKLK